jgi:hypothetical protein
MSLKKISGLIAVTGAVFACMPAVSASAAAAAPPYCGMYSYKPYKSGSTVLGNVQAAGCTGRPWLTATLKRDNSTVSSTSSYGPWNITLTTGCASGSHQYQVSLKNNDNGVSVSSTATIAC